MSQGEVRSLLQSNRLVFLDGGMGTQLQARGLAAGDVPEEWCVDRPDAVREVHAAYVAAGSDIVCTNTFGANPAKYHGRIPLAEVVPAAVELARASGARGVALDVGPTGRLLGPDFSFDAAYDSFAEQIRLGAAAGADLVAIETMGDAWELKAAVLAAKENCSLPVFATVALGENGKLLTGADCECVAALLEGLRVDAMGFNCGLGPDLMLPFVRRLAAVTSRPIIVKPNAGLPTLVEGKTVFPVEPEEFARHVEALVAAGAAIVGGCCGTTPAHIAALHSALAQSSRPRIGETGNRTVISSGTHALEIPAEDSIVIGERINPTGKKRLKQALLEGDLGYVLREAVTQAEAGAQALDVNVGVPGIDEPAVLDATVQAVQTTVDLPLQLDSSNPAALALAMRHCNGKPLVNSVNGKQESLDAVLPLVAKYGGVVVALTLDEAGIPATAEGRLAIARRIVERGAEYGLRPQDFVIDALCLAVSADPASARVTLETVRRVRAELGCRTVLGVSNISFGLPSRPTLNAAFYSQALGAGLSAAIVNPLSAEMMNARRAWRALMARDTGCAEWIASQQAPSAVASPAVAAPEVAPDNALYAAIRRGLKADAADAARAALAAHREPMQIIEGEVVPALEAVGRGFEGGTLFLPQLLMAADAASAAFTVIRGAMSTGGGAAADGRRPLVLATVKGDIHDIGKNICRAVLENYGFEVIDLGRDVEPEQIVQVARERGAGLVGLSALMTTTVPAMERTIQLLHAELPQCPVVVGGAVLTPDFAAKIGADRYSRDAMEMVRITREVLG